MVSYGELDEVRNFIEENGDWTPIGTSDTWTFLENTQKQRDKSIMWFLILLEPGPPSDTTVQNYKMLLTAVIPTTITKTAVDKTIVREVAEKSIQLYFIFNHYCCNYVPTWTFANWEDAYIKSNEGRTSIRKVCIRGQWWPTSPSIILCATSTVPTTLVFILLLLNNERQGWFQMESSKGWWQEQWVQNIIQNQPHLIFDGEEM